MTFLALEVAFFDELPFLSPVPSRATVTQSAKLCFFDFSPLTVRDWSMADLIVMLGIS